MLLPRMLAEYYRLVMLQSPYVKFVMLLVVKDAPKYLRRDIAAIS